MMQVSTVAGKREGSSATITVTGHLPSPAYSIASTNVQQSEGAFEIDFQVANRGGISPQVLKRFKESILIEGTLSGTYKYRILNNGELVSSGDLDFS